MTILHYMEEGADLSDFVIKSIKKLLTDEISDLVEESVREEFHFLKRLVNDYNSGRNRFDKSGESLYAVYGSSGKIIGVCGLNQDPYSQNCSVGRIRRLYISKSYRRLGIAGKFVEEVIQEAKKHYSVLVLTTDNPEADLFYQRLGFSTEPVYQNSTHHLELGD